MVTEAHVELPERWANPEMLKWARLRMGLQPKHVESLTNIRARRVVTFEEPKTRELPTLAELEELAEIYDCPVGYFFLESPPDAKPALDFRGLASEKTDALSYETHLHLSEFLRLTDHISFLVETLRVPWEVHIDVVDLEEPVEFVAQRERDRFGFTSEIREQWASADEAFDFWRKAIEARGVFVIALKLDPGEVRGASRWDLHHPPAILVNRMDMEAATGRSFTLLHEWAHLLAKRPGLVCDFRGQAHSAQVERFANMFAAEVLVPRKGFEHFLRREKLFGKRHRWGDPLLDKIRHNFKVSRDVVAILLEEMGLAPSGFYHAKRATWDLRRPFFRGREGAKRGQTKAMRRLVEIGLPLAKLVSAAYDRGVVSKLDLADLLSMRVEQAERFVLWVQEQAGVPEER